MKGRKTTLALANIAVGTVLGLVAQKLIALYWGPTYSGQFTFALSIVGIAFFITDLGMGQAHVKRVSEGRHAGDCFATFAVFKIVATGAFVVFVSVGLWAYTAILGRTLEDTTLTTIAFIVLFFVAKSLQEIGQSSFDARLETAKLQATAFSDTLLRVVLTVVFAFVLAASIHGTGPLVGVLDEDNFVVAAIRADPAASLAFAQMAGGVAAALVAVVLLLRLRERGKFSWDLLKDYWTFALPLFMTSIVTTLTAHIDGAALGLFLDAAQTGIFGRVRAIVTVIASVGPVVGSLLFPTISGLAARGEGHRIAGEMDRAIRYLSMLLAPIVLFTIFFAEAIIHLVLSDEFIPGAPTMGILAAYVYVTTIGASHANLIMGMGQPRLMARIGISTAITVIVLDLVLVPHDIKSLGIPLAGLGMEGAAIGTLASGLLYLGLVTYGSRKVAGYRQQAGLWKHALGGLLMVAALKLLAQVAPLAHWYDFLLYMAAGGAAYLLALGLLREFTRDDWRFVQQSIHPIEMLRYVRDELFQKKR